MLPWAVGNYSNFIMGATSSQQGSLYQTIDFHQFGASPNMVPTLAAAIQVVVEFSSHPTIIITFYCFLLFPFYPGFEYMQGIGLCFACFA